MAAPVKAVVQKKSPASFEAGLADKVDIRLQDYRDERGRYDRIASIEMLEAVGEKFWPAYFAQLRHHSTTFGTT